MDNPGDAHIIAQTKKWISDVVVGCNFCPFAAKEIKRDSIHYQVLNEAITSTALAAVLIAMQQLDNDETIETSFLILPGTFALFEDYLDLLDKAEALLLKENYESIYQIASFHPAYLFAGSSDEDAANYTNRSPYCMFHFLREASLSKAIDSYPAVDDIPQRNIDFANKKGLQFMQQLLGSSAGHA